MKLNLSKILCLCYALSSAWYSIGQNNELRSYTLEDGLPQSQVYAMLQDDIGYLWLGTQGGGLARFDGQNFKTFNESDGLASNYINALDFANDSLFIGTKRGLSIKTKQRFHNFSCPQVMSIFRHDKHVFIGTTSGLYRFDKGGSLQKLALNPTLDANQINAVVFDGHSFWLASNKGLFQTDTLSKAIKIEAFQQNDFTDLIVSDRKLIASSFTDGIYIFDLKNNTEIQHIESLIRVNSMSIINNQLWVATDFDGISVLDMENFQIQKEINNRSGLSVLNIRQSMTDRQGTIWIATSGGGLYKYFENEFTHFDKETGLEGNRIYAVHNNNRQLWISNSEAGMTMIDSLGIHPIPKVKGFENVKIKTITNDEKGNIWAGSDGKGILFRQKSIKDSLILDMSDLKNILIDTLKIPVIKNHVINESNGFPSDWIRQLSIQKDTIWAATYSDGIVKMQFDSISEKVNILKVFGQKEGIEDLLFKGMKPDNRGRIWYSTQTGHLGVIESDKVTDFGMVLSENTAINSLLFKEKTLFLGTAGNGIWVSTQDNFSGFKKLSGDKQLTSNNCYQLIFDREYNLWVGTEKGVEKIILGKNHTIEDVFHFGRNDGFLGIETCLNAVDMDQYGNLWFGAIYGLTKYDVSQKSEEAVLKPNITFENIQVNYQPVDSILTYSNQYSESTLKLQPHQNQLSFTYRTIDLNHPKDIQYRFKLNDDAWSPWSETNEQNLVGLGYGKHVFYAQSQNFRWQKSDPISFSFFIETPLHQKAWFQWLVIGFVLFLMLFFGWFYFRRLKKRNAEEKARLEVQNHLLTLEHKALQLQMNPHFIFNVLNGIKGMASTNSQKMNTTINTFATLLREVLNNSRKDSISLEQEMKTLKNYIEIEQLMAPNAFEYTIQIDSDIATEEILIPPMLIQPFVENAIRHGILKGTRAGELKLKFKTNAQFLECTIIDNGQGIFHSQQTKTTTDHQSMALTVTKERIASIAGKDRLKIEEIKSDGLILGTKISFQIPLKTDF